MQEYYLALDFESWPNPNAWCAAGFILYNATTNQIISFAEFFVDRRHEFQDEENMEFWKHNIAALTYCNFRANGQYEYDVECEIVKYVSNLKVMYPNLYLLTDTGFDLRIINNILVKHGRTVMSHRGKGIYRQSLCTWSIKLTVQQLLGVSSSQLTNMMDRLNSRRNPDAFICGPRHTPLSDCQMVLQKYLQLRDFMHLTLSPMLSNIRNL
jgi:hypothetical protein